MKRRSYKGKNNPNYGNHFIPSEEWIKKQRIINTGKNNPFYGKKHSLKTKQRISLSKTGKIMSSVAREHMSQGKKKLWSNPEYKASQLIKIRLGMKNKPTTIEKSLDYILQTFFPNEYKYVGDGTFWIEGFNPDFIHHNKKIIEVYGDYWHNTKEAKERDKIRLATYKKHNYKVLIIWEKEILTLFRDLIHNIRKFTNE